LKNASATIKKALPENIRQGFFWCAPIFLLQFLQALTLPQ
jgi:hypothetical protein